jgi:hypothetical protein
MSNGDSDFRLAILPTRAKDDETPQQDENLDEQDSFDITINRAELVAIKEALGAGYTHIATDSLASVHPFIIELKT